MTALLTDNLPLLAGAPNGIKKLRELILELAVRGKLVPQDPKDEPASELLNLLMTEAGSATGRGKGKKQALPGITESEQLFILPEGWVWGRLGDVTEVLDSLRKPVTKQDRKPGPYPYYGASGVVDYVSAYIFDEPLVLVGEDGAKWGAGERTAFSISGKTWVNNHAHVLRPKRSVVLDDYLVISLVAQDLSQFITGMTVPKLNQARLTSIGISLPPLAEQHRIVAKVDELMALCDRLEARQADADSAHTQLVQALLDSLTQARDAGDFAQSWQRLAEHFHTLFTTESCIDALKQTLLQLAVRGKLVPQIPEEKEAINWLDSIQLEKQRLQLNRLHQNVNRATGIEIETPATEVPESWRWVSLADITLGMDSGWSPACEPTPSPSDSVWGVLKTTAVQVLQYLEGENKELPAHLEPRPDAEVKAGDILFTRAGPTNRVGVSCLVESTRSRLMISDKIIRFHPVEVGAYGRYIALCLNTGATAMYLELAKSGMAASQVNISQEKLKRAPIPFPPLPEQHRIVAKVDQLMGLCDQLKARLNQACQLHEQLAHALVEQAVA